MNKFWLLFKHELKMQIPLPPKKGGRYDPFGVLLMALVVLLISAVFVMLLSAVVSGYVLVKVDKVLDPILRSKELLNVCYIFVLSALVLAGLENMRRSLTDRQHRELFLRMPVSSQIISLSKLATVLLSSYLLALVLLATVSVIFYTSAPLPASFIWRSVAVWLLMPLVSFLISTLLLIPYIKLVELISDKYALLLVLVTAFIMVAFTVYSRFLEAVKTLYETGSIKYLFNEKFVSTLQELLARCYPATAFTDVALGGGALLSLVIVLALALSAPVAAHLVSKHLYTSTMYKNERVRRVIGKKKIKRLPPLWALIKKEFICIYRDPKSTFSYFAVAASMPVMVYCCYTLFDSLVVAAIGMTVSFPLALITVLVFSILTNTFCATNVSRDGEAAMKVKIFPKKASTILLAKVLLCAAVSSLSILASLIVLVIFAGLSPIDALVATPIVLAFSLAQIFVATRMDLGGARLSSSLAEMRRRNDITIAKVVTLGIFLALVSGILSVASYVLSLGSTVSFIEELGLSRAHAYVLPAIVSALYLGAALAYYRIGIEKSLEGLSV